MLVNSLEASQKAIRDDIVGTLRSMGIPRNSQNWQDYRMAKRLISEIGLTSSQYLDCVQKICSYLGL